MWLATKTAARRKKTPEQQEYMRPDLIQRQLGPDATLQDGITYNRLLDKHPGVERRHDEDIASHYERLKKAEQNFQDRPNPDALRMERAKEEGKLRVPVVNETPTDPWVGQLPSGGNDLKGMPQRIPGWFTGDALDKAPAGYGVPPMSRRDPMATMRAPESPVFAPQLPTREEWVRGLADKGIFLDADGRRMSPEDMVLPHRPVRGHDIWESFTRPPVGRHRASQTVVAFVRRVLADEGDDAIARWQRRHKAMTDAGWDFHESGSGNWYEKNINGQRHRIMSDTMSGKPGWTHQDASGRQFFYDDLRDALLHAHRGQGQAGFKPPPPPDPKKDFGRLSSWSDE